MLTSRGDGPEQRRLPARVCDRAVACVAQARRCRTRPLRPGARPTVPHRRPLPPGATAPASSVCLDGRTAAVGAVCRRHLQPCAQADRSLRGADRRTRRTPSSSSRERSKAGSSRRSSTRPQACATVVRSRAEDLAHLRQGEAARHVRQVHGHLPGEGGAGASTCSRPKVGTRHHEYPRHGLLEHLPHELVRNPRARPSSHTRQGCEHGLHVLHRIMFPVHRKTELRALLQEGAAILDPR